MAESRFVYVTYIRTTPEKLWQALIDPEFTRQYWVETWQECEWKPGASWRLMIPDGRVGDSGEVLEIEPERRLVLTWRNEFKPELRDGRLFPPDLRARAAGRVGQAHRHPRDATSPTRSSSRWYRTAGRTSWPASRACSKRANRSKPRAAGPRGCREAHAFASSRSGHFLRFQTRMRLRLPGPVLNSVGRSPWSSAAQILMVSSPSQA